MREVIISYSAPVQDFPCSPFPADFQLAARVPTLPSLLMGVTVHRVWLLLFLALAHRKGFRQRCSEDNMPVNPIFHLQAWVMSSEIRVSLLEEVWLPRKDGKPCPGAAG